VCRLYMVSGQRSIADVHPRSIFASILTERLFCVKIELEDSMMPRNFEQEPSPLRSTARPEGSPAIPIPIPVLNRKKSFPMPGANCEDQVCTDKVASFLG
jgi:hypothetical protein